MRRSTVLRHPLQVRVPRCTHHNVTHSSIVTHSRTLFIVVLIVTMQPVVTPRVVAPSELGGTVKK
jgi:hypothetical protein